MIYYICSTGLLLYYFIIFFIVYLKSNAIFVTSAFRSENLGPKLLELSKGAGNTSQ